MKQECVLMVNPQIVSGSPLSFKIDTELQNGPCLLLNQPIPLKIDITKHGNVCCGIILNEFQTMLVEKTQVKAQGITESSTSTWIVQSSANMDYPVALAKSRAGKVVTLRDSIYSQHPLPPGLTSSFEVCNIKRTYRLIVRLGFLIGDYQVMNPFLEEYFHVVLVANRLSFLFRLRQSSRNSISRYMWWARLPWFLHWFNYEVKCCLYSPIHFFKH